MHGWAMMRGDGDNDIAELLSLSLTNPLQAMRDAGRLRQRFLLRGDARRASWCLNVLLSSARVIGDTRLEARFARRYHDEDPGPMRLLVLVSALLRNHQPRAARRWRDEVERIAGGDDVEVAGWARGLLAELTAESATSRPRTRTRR